MKRYISVVKSNREKVSLLDETDVNITMVGFVENYLESFEVMKKNQRI